MGKQLMVHQGAELYGSDKIFLFVVEIFISSGHEVIAVLDSDGPLRAKLEHAGAEVIIRKLGVFRRNVISSPLRFLAFLRDFIAAVWFFSRLIARHRPSIVYVNTLAVLSPLACRMFFRDVRYIHHLHEIQSKPKAVVAAMYNFSVFAAHEVVVVSDAVGKHLKQVSSERFRRCVISRIYNGIDRPEIEEAERRAFIEEFDLLDRRKAGEVLIAVVGRIHPWKGQYEFLDILSGLEAGTGKNYHALFFGDVFDGYESFREKFVAKIANLNLSEKITFCGNRNDAHILFSECDIAVLPSIEPDPLPTVVLEAMSFGKPVIAYRMGGAVEMIVDGKTGILIEGLDASGFIARLASLISDSSMRTRLGENALSRFEEHFALSDYQSRISALIERNISV
ncbi:MAG: glycosyltransferase family 4 protein [Gammaproteobacteria bacterium]|nr:glycosyltransferase family 4 protein [Gammaproteobacteria bacterium]